MLQYVVYDKPSDFPEEFVVREFLIEPGKVIPKDIIIREKTLQKARAKLPKNLTLLPVFEDDDPCIVEVWIR